MLSSIGLTTPPYEQRWVMRSGRGFPLVANVYLHQIDRVWDVREHGTLVRYADNGLFNMTRGEARRDMTFSLA